VGNPAKILVVGPSWVGDMVMAQSLFMMLKASKPDSQIDVLAPAWSLPLLERMPEVANAIVLPLKHGEFGLLARFKLGRRLRSENYHQAIVLPNSWKSALIPFFARIPLRTGFVGECRWGLLSDARMLDKTVLTMTVQRFVALALPAATTQPPTFSNPLLPINKAAQQAVIQKFGLKLDKKILALCPGAEFGPSKRWPADYFAELALAKMGQGWQVWLLGSGQDQEAAAAISTLIAKQYILFGDQNSVFKPPHPSPLQQERGQERRILKCDEYIDLVGLTTLAEAIDLLALADTVVANDSGLMHLAAALDKKVIALYGSTPPDFAPPLNAAAKSVSLKLPCSPCQQRHCPLYPEGHAAHNQCLTGIKPVQVLELIDD
jgi:heptosyltransferase II